MEETTLLKAWILYPQKRHDCQKGILPIGRKYRVWTCLQIL